MTNTDKTDKSRANSLERISPAPVDFPPKAENRNFNENDILGDLDRDERGNLILLENKQG